MGPAVAIFDCAEAVARQVARVVDPWETTAKINGAGQVEYVTSGEAQQLSESLTRLQAAGALLPPGLVRSDPVIV
jgi:hypothetical protein